MELFAEIEAQRMELTLEIGDLRDDDMTLMVGRRVA